MSKNLKYLHISIYFIYAYTQNYKQNMKNKYLYVEYLSEW